MKGQPVCPECRAGKHINCNGQAWDEHADELTVCFCTNSHHFSSRNL